MVKRNIRSKSRTRSITLKKRSKNAKRRSAYLAYRTNSVLDTSVSVRNMLKFSGIALACIIVFVCIFMLGRISATDSITESASSDTHQLSGETKQVVKNNSDNTEKESSDESQETEKKETNRSISVVNLSETEDNEKPYEPEIVYTVATDAYEPEPIVEQCRNKVAIFDHNYTNIAISASNFQRELKGNNWATITSLKLSITNNEKCTIINPTKVKIKMNPKGKGSVWWDDDVSLSDSFDNMLPGATVTEIIPVHVSYSDIFSEKDFRLTVFDDYDIQMGTFKKYIILP